MGKKDFFSKKTNKQRWYVPGGFRTRRSHSKQQYGNGINWGYHKNSLILYLRLVVCKKYINDILSKNTFHKMMILFNVLKFKHGSEMNLSYVEDLLETPPRFSSRWFLGQNLLVFYELSSLSDDEVMSGKRIVASISGLWWKADNCCSPLIAHVCHQQCSAVQLHFKQCPFPNRFQFGSENKS